MVRMQMGQQQDVDFSTGRTTGKKPLGHARPAVDQNPAAAGEGDQGRGSVPVRINRGTASAEQMDLDRGNPDRGTNPPRNAGGR